MQDIVPIKLYEYMAMEKPVIATALPGVMKEFGEDNGVFYISGPEETIIKAKNLAKSGKIKGFGVKARKFVERYDWNKLTDEFESVLQGVIKGKRR
jgi:glycosyltransferase involved in cell wall biosynthesis